MGSILTVNEWTTPCSAIPEGTVGTFHIRKRVIERGKVLSVGAMSIEEVLFNNDAIITILREGVKEDNDTESVWMSDTPMEYFKASELVARAQGPRILVGGLGLGLVTHLLALRRDITDIVVIERQPEVLALVKESLPAHVHVAQADFMTALAADNMGQFDTVIADIWKTGCDDEDRELYEDVRMTVDDYQPNAVQLYWAFQEDYDDSFSFLCLAMHKQAGTLALPAWP